MLPKSLLFASVFLLLFRHAYAQTQSNPVLTGRIDSLLSSRFQADKPGCVVLVAKKGQIVFEKAYGSANLELNVPIQTGMVFRLGSITKQFTAVAILQLLEQGKLSLQDSVQQYITDYPHKQYKITLENLLTHTSGIPDYLQLDNPDPYIERRDFTPEQLISSFKDLPIQFAPGSRFSYSNSGYVLLGRIIEKVSGESYEGYIQKHLLNPLSISHTYFKTGGNIIPGLVNGYGKEGQVYKDAGEFSLSLAYSAGALLSNAEDLMKWEQGLYTYKLVKKATLEKATRSYLLTDGSAAGYGYGWYVNNTGGIRSIEHGGKISGFLTNEIYYPGEDILIVALFNSDDAPRDELSIALSSIVLGRNLQQAVTVPIAQLDQYTGTYALSTNPRRTMTISRQNDYLSAAISGQETFQLFFQSESKFQLKGVTGADGEFILRNGKVSAMKINQNGTYIWNKVK